VLARLQELFTLLFHTYIGFAILILADHLSQKDFDEFTSRSLSRYWVVPLAVGVLEGLCDAHGLLGSAGLYGVNAASRFAQLALVAWTILKLARAWRESDGTDRVTPIVHTVGLLGILMRALTLCVGWYWSPDLPERTFEWVVTFCTYNAFVLMMSYFHWPCDPLHSPRTDHGID
jgi:hypothetical protein